MDLGERFLIFYLKFVVLMRMVEADTYSVKLGTSNAVNVVDSRFLSFTVDPKYLFSSSDKFDERESFCMASSLTPAYIRIAGPSTSLMTFHERAITFNVSQGLGITHNQWTRFAGWAKKTGFDLVFALNNEEKVESGLWDPNMALDILTVAEKANVSDIFWQLGYGCNNQSIEEYLNDLETLRVIVETFPSRKWRVVGGDVTDCLDVHSKSDFKDYVALSEDMLDAVLLNGNSSAQQLEQLSKADRLKLLKLLSNSTKPLWLTETRLVSDGSRSNQFYRAADWIASLGYSARNGFLVNFRELIEEELFEPTLSFYMALLYKNLVGVQVLDVAMDRDDGDAVLFAHCTSLRHKPVSGAVTLYAVNMDEEPARFSVRLSQREEGGDIMQFILGNDRDGNITVNSRTMSHDGDLRPVVKRIRPFKTLVLNLPSKSFGFWVLANTHTETCKLNDKGKEEVDEEINVDEEETQEVHARVKRSVKTEQVSTEELNFYKEFNNDNDIKDASFKKSIDNLNEELKKTRKLFEEKSRKNKLSNRVKRESDQVTENGIRKLLRHGLKSKINRSKTEEDVLKPRFDIFKKLFGTSKLNTTKHVKHDLIKKYKQDKSKVNKRSSKQAKVTPRDYTEETDDVTEEDNILNRRRRNVVSEKKSKSKEEYSLENEVDVDSENEKKLWKILHKIHEELGELPSIEDTETKKGEETKEEDEIVVRTKMSNDGTSINYSEKFNNGILKSTISNLLSVVGDLNKNLNRFWDAISLLD